MNSLVSKIKKIALLAGDIAVLYLSLLITLWLSYGSDWHNNWRTHFFPFSVLYLSALLIFYILGLYDFYLARNNLYFFSILAKALVINAIVAIIFFYFIPGFGIAPKTHLFISLLVFAALFILWRQFYNFFIKSSAMLKNILILGQGQEVQELTRYIKDNPQLGYRIKKATDPKEFKIIHNLTELLIQEKIQLVVTSVTPAKNEELIRSLYQCLPLKITVADLPAFYEKTTGKIPVSAIKEIWFLENLMNDRKTIFENIKRITDILITALIGFIALILMPVIIALAKLSNQGPIFEREKRVGRDNRIFETIKFRTGDLAPLRQTNPDRKPKKLSGVKKRGHLDQFLRRTRLDRLPELWNVLKGDLSLVGPNPERPEFAFNNRLLSEIPFYQIRYTVKPGLTGWAQIEHFDQSAGGEPNLIQKLQYDLYYIKNRSFFLDLAIILKTIKIILSGSQ